MFLVEFFMHKIWIKITIKLNINLVGDGENS
jgi:hypothetical protein